MSRPYQVGGECYVSISDAMHAHAAKYVPGTIQSGTTTYMLDVTPGSNDPTFGTPRLAYIATPYLCNGAACANTTSITRYQTWYPEACVLVDIDDAGTMAWLVVAAWVGVYCMRLLWTRALR